MSEVEPRPERTRARALAGAAAFLGLVCGLGWSIQAVLLMIADTGAVPDSLAAAPLACIYVGSFAMLVASAALWLGLVREHRPPRGELLLLGLSGLLAGLPVFVQMAIGIVAEAIDPPAVARAPGPFEAQALVLSAMCVNWSAFPLTIGLLAAYTWIRHRGHLD